jgi:hypothetical protein
MRGHFLRASLAGAAGWSPLSLGGLLQAWFDGKDSSTFTLNGSKVSEWRDKSSNLQHLSQAVDGNRPTLSGSNVVFNSGAASHVLISPSSATVSLRESSVHIVYLMRADWVGGGGIFTADGGNGTGHQGVDGFDIDNQDRQDKFVVRMGHQTISNIVNIGIIQNAPTVSLGMCSVRFSGGNAAVRLNGSINANSSASYSYLQMNARSTGAFGIGRGYNNGWTGIAAKATYREIVITDGAPSTEERQLIEGYLAHANGIQSLLPASHPYKVASP